MPSRCTEGFVFYEFEPDGSTRCVCIGGKFGNSRRTMCPHYGGKCPALGNNMRTHETHDVYLKMKRDGRL